MITNFINKIIGDPNDKELKSCWPIVKKINQIEEEYQKNLKDEDIPKKTVEFQERIAKGETLDQILPEAFALVKFACRRLNGTEWELKHLYSEKDPEGNNKKYTWNMIPYDVQLIGGIILHKGKIAEMKTGEGKTLVCTSPLYLNALSKKGAYLVTANEYLAQRDAEWMGILYNFLGLSVGVIAHGQNQTQKQAAYNCDITYGTNNEYGFDYLRDNMNNRTENLVQKELNYALVDEVDSILIDEARTPLIISAPAAESTDKYKLHSQYIRNLVKEEDYLIDEKQRSATLTEAGIAKMEKLLGLENIYTDAGFSEVHHLEQALKAQSIFKRDVDYVVKNNEIIIVDEFTGRLMEGRRYSDGLHQAIEAKENVAINRESRTLATITFQNYFRLFKKLGGMTGTAKTEAEEFFQIYGLETISIPTHRQVQRADQADMIFRNESGKFKAIAQRVKQANLIGQPVLIGTVSIEKSESLSRSLQVQGIPHSVLNAKFHEQEAEIVAKAGAKGSVTIATNMAGRGTDIKLDEETKKLGGLLVIGTERHESRRIDNQLRGRSGRQGDPGESQFFVSMEDDLMRLFGSERIQNMMAALNLPEETPIQNKLISNSIESAQKKVEGRNFDIRKHLVEYDDVMNKHREIIYSRRRKILFSENIKNDIILLIEKEAERIVQSNYSAENKSYQHDDMVKEVEMIDEDAKKGFDHTRFKDLEDEESLIAFIKNFFEEQYEKREKALHDDSILRRFERNIYLSVIDSLWMEHIDNMQDLRESVSLRGYGQRDPLIEYKEQGFIMFKQLLNSVQNNTINTLFKINLAQQVPAEILITQVPENLQTNESEIKDQSAPEFQEITQMEAAQPVSMPNQNMRNVSGAMAISQDFNNYSSSSTMEEDYEDNEDDVKPGKNGIRIIRVKDEKKAESTEKLGRNERCPQCGNKMKKCTCEK